MTYEHRTNYSRGWVVELVETGEEACSSWLLLPAENLWPTALRGFFYIVALLYLFMGVAIASDAFMCSIEVITSKKRKVVRWDEERQEKVEREVLLWNETVANLTLMALGSSAPEILLSTVETINRLDADDAEDSLGTFTIIGSAAFNLMMITAVCVVSVPTGHVKKIKEVGVFIVTSIWSIWAYLWMLLVVKYISAGVVDPWEGWVTLIFLPLFVLFAYVVDTGCVCAASKVEGSESEDEIDVEQPRNFWSRLFPERTQAVRVIGHKHSVATFARPKELRVLEAERARRISVYEKRLSKQTMYNVDRVCSELNATYSKAELAVERERKITSQSERSAFSMRARFRHSAVCALTGARSTHSSVHLGDRRASRLADVAAKVQSINQAIKQGKPPEDGTDALRRRSFTYYPSKAITSGDIFGKFTFASDRYAVLESAEIITVDVLFHRQLPLESADGKKARTIPSDGTFTASIIATGKSALATLKNATGTVSPSSTDVDSGQMHGVVSVDYETREGSAKPGKDFKYTSGTLTFGETDYRHSISIPIINNNQYEADVDFYIILKNPGGGAGLGDPSICRITVVDDDNPGEFLFEEPHYHADMKTGKVVVRVIREHGFDGAVNIEYSTVDGTAVGGEQLGPHTDYVEASDVLSFQHGDTSKQITVHVNKTSPGAKNFIIALRNPSLGAKIGIRSATVVHLNKGTLEDRLTDELLERVGEVLQEDEEENVTWGGQFVEAMTVGEDTNDDGEVVKPTRVTYLMHFLTFFWKVLCACIPPTSMGGAWPSFVTSLFVIGAMTACIEQLGHLLGCVTGLKTSVTGITLIALGTSLPDTFASRSAALQDENADAAIGNVTGSNSVNVFLGLGLPWVLSTMYRLAKGRKHKILEGNLAFGVYVFGALAVITVASILIRRKVTGGELGGHTALSKWLYAGFLVSLWFIYLVLSGLKAYDRLDF